MHLDRAVSHLPGDKSIPAKHFLVLRILHWVESWPILNLLITDYRLALNPGPVFFA